MNFTPQDEVTYTASFHILQDKFSKSHWLYDPGIDSMEQKGN